MSSIENKNESINLIGLAINAIKNDNLDQLRKILEIMPIEHLRDNLEILLTNFLSLCAGYNRPEACKTVLKRWKVVYPPHDKISMLSRLFMLEQVNVATLAFIVNFKEDYTFVELMDELISWDSSPEVSIACQRADQVFGKQPFRTYEMIKNKADEIGNTEVYNYMIGKIVEVSPFAEKPEYVQNFLSQVIPTYQNKIPKQEELNVLAEQEEKKEENSENLELLAESLDINQAVELLTEGLSSMGISIDEIDSAKEFLRNEMRNPDKKKELLMPILKTVQQTDLNKDRLLFWIYGPTNPLVNQDLTLDTPSSKYGGCRMFLCDLFDYNFEDDYLEDWFDGSCDFCLKRIEKRCYSVRKPRPHGGWQGCFCSFKCLRDEHNQFQGENMEPDILTTELIDLYEEKITSIGIQDRD